MNLIQSHHHLTLCVGKAQEDYDFHVGLLGLRSVKKTVLFDGTVPIYHFYYGNENGDPSTLITCFPFQQAGVIGRKGTGQIKIVNLSAPSGSLDFWAKRLKAKGYAFKPFERFGEKGLHFEHPCGIEYEIVGDDKDTRKPWTTRETPAEVAIKGLRGITVSLKDMDPQSEFMEVAFGARKTKTDGAYTRFEMGVGGAGCIVDFVREPDVKQGTWTFGAGTPHHCAFKVDNADQQKQFKDFVEGIGYTDVSDVKDRNYFHSVYFRTPGGALFEAAYSIPESFEIDEKREEFGDHFMLPPWLEDRREELMAKLEPIEYETSSIIAAAR